MFILALYVAFISATFTLPLSKLSTVQTCDDVFKNYQNSSYQVVDCISDPSTRSLFWRIDTALSWSNAVEACKGGGNTDSNLAVPKTTSQRMLVSGLITLKYIQQTHCWIGITKTKGIYKEKAYPHLFIDGSEIEPFRWSPYYNCSTGGNECGFVYLGWDMPNSVASPNSYHLGFYYCNNAKCDDNLISICQTIQSF